MQADLSRYIYEEKITDSGIWVILRFLFAFGRTDGRVSFNRIADGFFRYYQRRHDSGLLLDHQDSKVAKLGHLTPESVKLLLRADLLVELSHRGFVVIGEDEGKEYVGFIEEYWCGLSLGERAKLLAEVEIKLENYFTQEIPSPEGVLPLPCTFCQREHLKIVKENDLAFTVFDIFPAVPGHCLIIPKRHVRDVFDVTKEEIGAMLELLQEMKIMLDQEFQPDGFNIGFNVDYAAGQTVMHAHMHCFPRKWGDVENPRGGLRNIIPNWFKAPQD